MPQLRVAILRAAQMLHQIPKRGDSILNILQAWSTRAAPGFIVQASIVRGVADYFKLSVPRALADRYEQLSAARGELGYRSASEAMIDVLRRSIEELESGVR